jgi:hypothetical protein
VVNLRINIQTIPHDKQRYPTCGDWFYDRDGVLQIRVSEMRNNRHEMAVALHELIEAALCMVAHVEAWHVDDFDKNWEGAPKDEPGNDPKAPYHHQHVTASICERAIAQCLEISWNDYEKTIAAL